jgi:citrate lyase subunit beta / citryl-CoA lyase
MKTKVVTGGRMSGGSPRSFLFIPAQNAGMLAKINVFRPDAFVLDLEDAVPAQQKPEARKNILAQMAESHGRSALPPVYVRINDLDTPYPLDDIHGTFHERIAGFIVPKFESFVKLADIGSAIADLEKKTKRGTDETRLILQIESMKGLRELFRAEESPLLGRVAGLALGGEDFASSLSSFSEIDADMLSFARKMLVMHARSFGILAIDTIYRNFQDSAGLEEESRKVARMGFDGKLAIHPDQVDVINACLSPSNQDLERVKNILENQSRIEETGVIEVDGVMFDAAHLKWAQKVHELWLK